MSLSITEELLLLAVHDEKGSVILSSTALLPYGISASLLLDLKNLEKINFIDDKVVLFDYTPTGVDYLDEVLVIIKNENKGHRIRWWIRRLTDKYSTIRDEIFNHLVNVGILKREKVSFLFMVDFFRYPTLNPTPELQTRDKIHKSILFDIEPDFKLLALISLMYFCGLVKEVFPPEHRKKAKKTIKKLLDKSDKFGYLNDIVTELSIVIESANEKKTNEK